MPSIDRLAIRKILDSRGNATVEVDIVAGAALGRAAAPSGASTGALEAPSWPPGGVDGALRIFQDSIAPRLRGRDVKDQAGLDRTLRELDGTPNFARIGGNVATAVSLANAKAAAASAGKPLFRYLTGPQGPSIPLPLGNVIGGGRHAIGGTTIQEYLVVSQGPTALANVTTNARVHALVRDALMKRLPGVALGRGDEGAWVAQLQDEEALSLLADVCRGVEREAGFPVRPALDFAASEFYRGGKYRYRDRALSAKEQVDFVERLARDFPLFSVEDPFDQEDFGAFTELTKRIGDRCKVIGDDIFVTNVERLRRGIEQRAANAILIKPNQIGTLSETRAAVDLAHSAGYATVMSHRSGETTDDTIAHLAVAFGCLGIKTGAVGGERIAKLNELIRIEEQLQAGA
ncbi:MAG: phosphopyruvate hydratase [Methanobacteriota archaeon]|nr:MAG: phosphopyruvate hydratase [Euryarchaeota archaeon]